MRPAGTTRTWWIPTTEKEIYGLILTAAMTQASLWLSGESSPRRYGTPTRARCRIDEMAMQ
jgi:hypothetical protein